MTELDKQLQELGYIKVDRCIPKLVAFGHSKTTEGSNIYAHCPDCKNVIVRKIPKNTASIGANYKEYCSSCGQLLEIPYCVGAISL